MTGDEVGEAARVVDLYLSGRLCAADWRLWLGRRDEAERSRNFRGLAITAGQAHLTRHGDTPSVFRRVAIE
jgi:hypothetical protein